MPNVMLPATFVALLAEFRPVFTNPAFSSFVVLCAGFLHSLGKHRITDALRGAGECADKHYTSYYRFFSHACWSLDELGLTLLSLAIRFFPAAVIELVLDDTLCRRSGKKVALATIHGDPLLKQGKRPFFSYGHVFVILSVHIRLPLLGRTGWALPFLFRLFEGSRQGGRASSPSDNRRAMSRRLSKKPRRRRERLTDRKVVKGRVVRCAPCKDSGPLPKDVRPTKVQLAAELVLLVAQRFPNTRFRVLADHLYCAHDLLHEVHSKVDNVSFIVRGHGDAALFELPGPRPKGKRGRHRVRGKRLPSPEVWAQGNERSFAKATVDIYGHDVPMRLGSFTGMAYRSLPGRLVRYVVARDPSGVYKDDYILCTDPDLSEQEIIEAYSHRWPLERTFQECKQKLGLQDPEVQLPASVRRVGPFLMMLYSLVVLWYLLDGYKLAPKLHQQLDPWYRKTGRPSFSEMLASLRRLSWAEPFLDPPSQGATSAKTIAMYVARVVAVA